VGDKKNQVARGVSEFVFCRGLSRRMESFSVVRMFPALASPLSKQPADRNMTHRTVSAWS